MFSCRHTGKGPRIETESNNHIPGLVEETGVLPWYRFDFMAYWFHHFVILDEDRDVLISQMEKKCISELQTSFLELKGFLKPI